MSATTRRGSPSDPAPTGSPSRTLLRRAPLQTSLAALLLVGACTQENPGYCVDSPECGFDLAAGSEDLAGAAGVDLGGADLTSGKTDGPVTTPFDPAKPGSSLIAVFDLPVQVSMRGVVNTTVIGPSEDSMEISKRGPFPLVVISPGFSLDRKLFQSYGERLASYGIIAVLQKSNSEFNHTQYRDETVALLDWLVSPSGRSAERLAGRVDKTRIGLAGHSLGGKISLLVAERDARIKALLAIDPVDTSMPQARNELGRIKLATGIPLGFLGETTSKMGGFTPCTPGDSNYEVLYNRASAPAFSITVAEAAHNDFVDNFMMCGTCGFCPGGTAPKDRTNRLAVKYATAYFLWALKDEKRGADYLTGAELQKDVTAGYVTAAKK